MTDPASALTHRHCKPCEGGVDPLGLDAATTMLEAVPGWTLADSGDAIEREIAFRNFHEVMEFLNALAWIVHREDHHPELEVGYNVVRVHFSTHSISGLSDNDFICAARINALLD